MKSPLLFLVLFVVVWPTSALADQWIPYTDGRAGGCFQNSNGNLYGCTPQPSTVTAPQARAGRRFEYTPDPRLQQLQRANQALLRERFLRQTQESADKRALAREQNQRNAEVNAYLSAASEARGREEYRNWTNSRRNCDSSDYLAKLKSMGMKPHPSMQGICIRTPGKEMTQCPPCR